jgi:hypothetical protein
VRGIRYLVDESGNRTAVVIDLTSLGELWEDFHDRYLAEQRADEPRESLEEVEAMLGLATETDR